MYNATYIRYDKSHWGKTNKGGGGFSKTNQKGNKATRSDCNQSILNMMIVLIYLQGFLTLLCIPVLGSNLIQISPEILLNCT